MPASQAGRRGFDPRLPLHFLSCTPCTPCPRPDSALLHPLRCFSPLHLLHFCAASARSTPPVVAFFPWGSRLGCGGADSGVDTAYVLGHNSAVSTSQSDDEAAGGAVLPVSFLSRDGTGGGGGRSA